MTRHISIKLRRHLRRRLERLARKTKDARHRTRLQIVLLYDKGWGCDAVSEALGCAPSHAVRIAQRFLEDGEDGLVDGRSENGTPKVDDDLLEAMRQLVARQPGDYGWARSTWSRELLAKTLRRETGIKVSTRTIGRMLDATDARYGMARPVARLEWSPARKSRRVRRILAAVRARPKREPAYYVDELDVHLNPKIGRDWMLPRTQKEIVTPGQNEKRFLYGALEFEGNDLHYTTSPHKNSDGFIEFLEKLRAVHPNARRIHLILDNYVIHKSKKTLRHLDEVGVFVLHFLPPYSPEHNKIERLWRDLHGSVTRNHRCPTMADLMRRVRQWLDRQAKKRRKRTAVTARRSAAA